MRTASQIWTLSTVDLGNYIFALFNLFLIIYKSVSRHLPGGTKDLASVKFYYKQ